jgi:putative flippase GtrA
MAKAKQTTLSALSFDLSAATLLGLLAGIFAAIVASNLGFLGQTFFGVTVSWPLIVIGFTLLCMAGILVGRFLARYVPFLYNFVKFGEAGGLNWLVDMGIVNLLILFTGFSAGIYFAIFKAVSFVIAATNSFFWNKLWVFKGSAKQKEGKEITKFIIATAMGMAVNVALAYTISFFGPSLFTGIADKVWANYATIAGSLTAMLFNFVLYKVWVFKADK